MGAYRKRMYMKIVQGIILSGILAVSVTACGTDAKKQETLQTQTLPESTNAVADSKIGQEEPPGQEGNSKILIAYFSVPEDVEIQGVDAVASASVVVRDDERLGNTEYVAQTIQETIGGDLFRIDTTEAYPTDHDPLVDQAADEQDENLRPELATHVENFGQYETILLGFPNWWGDMPMPVYSFLEEYDFRAKEIIPFITHGGSRASRTIETISEIQPDTSVWDDALILSRDDVADSKDTITEWAMGLGIAEGDNSNSKE